MKMTKKAKKVKKEVKKGKLKKVKNKKMKKITKKIRKKQMKYQDTSFYTRITLEKSNKWIKNEKLNKKKKKNN